MDNVFEFFNYHILKSFEFIKTNFSSILIIIWILLILIIYITVMDLSFDTKKNTKVTKITIEKMSDYTSLEKENSKKKCETNNKEELCEKQNIKESCNVLDCCVWSKSKKGSYCVEGTTRGPASNLDKNGNTFEEYWYKKENKKKL